MIEKTAFVLMPFSAEFDGIYDFLIRQPLEECGYHAYRADDLLNQRNILQDIVSGILESDLIVADLSGSNPNVYYELGLAHASKKKVVLLTQSIDDVPFDLRSYRILPYDMHFEKMNEARAAFIDLVKKHKNEELKFSSPIIDYSALSGSSVGVHAGTPSPHLAQQESGERGLLDYQADLEESMELLGEIVREVGERLTKLTVGVTSAGEQLTAERTASTKKRRSAMRELARETDDYVKWLSEKGREYDKALATSGECLDGMFSGEFAISDEAEPEIRKFVDTLGEAADGAISGRDGFQGMVDSIERMPRIEREFDRSAKGMAAETTAFIGRIDKTASIISRARLAAMALLEKNEKSESDEWDRRIEEDVLNGKLDDLAEAALAEHKSGNSRKL